MAATMFDIHVRHDAGDYVDGESGLCAVHSRIGGRNRDFLLCEVFLFLFSFCTTLGHCPQIFACFLEMGDILRVLSLHRLISFVFPAQTLHF